MNLFIQKDPVVLARNLHNETKLPVLAVDPGGSVLSSFGEADRNEGITRQLIRQMAFIKEPDFHAMTLSDGSGNHYTASFIQYCRKNKGFLLVGPYSGDVMKLSSPGLCQFDQLYYTKQIRGRSCSFPLCKAGLSPAIQAALDFTLRNYSSQITLEDAAEAAGLNKTYFCTLFKKETAQTYTQFLNMVRIEEARELLAETTQSMLEVAFAVGYNNQNYFSIQFKKRTGLTAGEYRRMDLRERESRRTG